MLRVCLLLTFLIGGSISVGSSTIKQPEVIVWREVIFTIDEKIANVLQDSGYSSNMQAIILAKADLESGEFRNNLTKKHNNVFSMLHSKYDPYSKCGCGFAEGRLGYASYPTIEEQVYAYIWYTKKRGYPKEATPEQYIRYMKSKGYFVGDPKLTDEQNVRIYLAGVLARIDKYKK